TRIPLQEIYVSTTGNDVIGEGTEANPWQNITFAIQTVAPFATAERPIAIRLAPGTYEERVAFAPHVRLVGAGTETVLQHFDLQAPPHTVVTMAEDTVLS